MAKRVETENMAKLEKRQVLRKPEVCRLVGLGYTTLWCMMNKGEFPKPIKLSRKAVGWWAAEVMACWILASVAKGNIAAKT